MTRNRGVLVLLTADERALVNQTARVFGRSTNEWIRSMVLEAVRRARAARKTG